MTRDNTYHNANAAALWCVMATIAEGKVALPPLIQKAACSNCAAAAWQHCQCGIVKRLKIATMATKPPAFACLRTRQHSDQFCELVMQFAGQHTHAVYAARACFGGWHLNASISCW